MDPDEVGRLLGVIAEHATRLREAGVNRLVFGDVELYLAPSAGPANDRAEDPPEDPDPLNDPVTFGRLRGVPGRVRAPIRAAASAEE